MTKRLTVICPHGKKSHGEVSLRRSVLTAKCTYGEVSLRQSVLTANCPYNKMSLRRSGRMANYPYGLISYGEMPYREKSYGEKSSNGRAHRWETAVSLTLRVYHPWENPSYLITIQNFGLHSVENLSTFYLWSEKLLLIQKRLILNVTKKTIDCRAETRGENQTLSLKSDMKLYVYTERKIFAKFRKLLCSNLVNMFHTETRNAENKSFISTSDRVLLLVFL